MAGGYSVVDVMERNASNPLHFSDGGSIIVAEDLIVYPAFYPVKAEVSAETMSGLPAHRVTSRG